jgi:hypothetical protein
VLSQLLEHGLSAEELNIAQEALEVFIELIKYEKSVKTNILKDLENCLNSLSEGIMSCLRKPY